MASKTNLEFKVGIFAFIGLVILTLAVFSITEVHIFRPGYFIKVGFSFASGIDVGAAVRVAGIEVGEVKDIRLECDKNRSRAKITLLVWLDDDINIPQDSCAYVNSLGLIGERYLEIIPGEDYAHLLKDGDMLAGRDPLSLDSLMEVVHKLSASFDDVLDSVNEVLDEPTKEDLKATIHNFREFSHNLNVITGRLERGEGKLGAWLKPTKRDIKARKTQEPKESKTAQPRQNF